MSLSDYGHGFSSFHDYFGLSNLLSNVKISDDNPLLHSTQKNLALLQRARRQSWGSDGSDNAAVLSPTMENQHHYDRFDMNNNVPEKLPSMRLSRAMRDHIVSGAYQQQIENRNSEKYAKQPLIMPPPSPTPPSTQQPPPVLNVQPQPPAGQRGPSNGVQVCVFCRNNGESESVYTSHVLKDSDGRTACPILRAYTCPICKANGDNSHTIKYCPMNQNARLTNMMGQGNQQNLGFVPRNFRPPFQQPPPPPNMPMGQPHPQFHRMNSHNKK